MRFDAKLQLSQLKIVRGEGPILTKKAYDIYLRGCGIKRMDKDLKSKMNKAMQRCVSDKLIIFINEEVECGLLYSTVRLPEQPNVILRSRGSRSFDEIPLSEIAELSKYFGFSPDFTQEDLDMFYREILSKYETKRLTNNIKERLSAATECSVPDLNN